MFPNWQQAQAGFPAQQQMFAGAANANFNQMYWYQQQQTAAWPGAPGGMQGAGPNPPLPSDGSKPPLPANPAPPSDEDKPPLPPEPPPEEAKQEDLAPKSEEEQAKLNQLQQQAAQWQQQKQQPWGQQHWGMAAGMGQGFQQPGMQSQALNSSKQMLNAVLQEEKDFEIQYKQWKQQYDDWKKQNENHPNKEQFHQYEQQWRTYEKQMDEKQTDILQRKQDLQGKVQAAEQSMMNQQMAVPGQVAPGQGQMRPGGPGRGQMRPGAPGQGQMRPGAPGQGQIRPGMPGQQQMRPGMDMNRMQGPRGQGPRGQRPQFDPKAQKGGNPWQQFNYEGGDSMGDDMELEEDNGEQELGGVGGNFGNFGPRGPSVGGQNRFGAPVQNRFPGPRSIDTPVPNNPFRLAAMERMNKAKAWPENKDGPKPLMSLTFDEEEESYQEEEYYEDEYQENYEQNQNFGAGPRFGPRGAMANQRPRFGMRGAQNQNRFGFPGNQQMNRFPGHNRMQNPNQFHMGENAESQQHRQNQGSSQQSWLQKHLQGPQKEPQHPLPGSKGAKSNLLPNPKNPTGIGQNPTAKIGQAPPVQSPYTWMKDQPDTKTAKSQESITEEIKSLQKQQEMLNELKKFEKGSEGQDEESEPNSAKSEEKGKASSQSGPQNQQNESKPSPQGDKSQKQTSPTKPGQKPGPPVSQSMAPPSQQGPRPTAPGQQGARPPTPGQQGARPPTPGQQGARPPTPGQQGARPPTPGQQGARTPTPGQHGARPPTPGQQSARLPTSGQQGARPPTPGQQDAKQGSLGQQGSRPPTPGQQGARPPTPGQHGARPPTPGQQGARPPTPGQQGARPPTPGQKTDSENKADQKSQPAASLQGEKIPEDSQGQPGPGPFQHGQRMPFGQRPPGPNQHGQRQPGPNQQGQRFPGPNQQGQRPPGPHQQGQKFSGPNQQGQRPQGPGQRVPGPNQQGQRPQGPGQRMPGPNQQGNRMQTPNQFGPRSSGPGQGFRHRGPAPNIQGSWHEMEEEGNYENEEFTEDENQGYGQNQRPYGRGQNFSVAEEYEDNGHYQDWNARGRGRGWGRGRGADRGRGRGRGDRRPSYQQEDQGYGHEEEYQGDWEQDQGYDQKEEVEGMESEGERYMETLRESGSLDRDYGRGPPRDDYRRDPYGDGYEAGYGRYGRRSPPPQDPYDRVPPPHDPYGRLPPPERDPYYDRRDPYDRYDPYPRRDAYGRPLPPDPYEYDRRPYHDPYRAPYDYSRDYRYPERYPPPEDKPFVKPEVIDHGHKPTEFSAARETTYTAPQVIDYGHGKQDDRESDRGPSAYDRDRERLRDLPLSYGSPGGERSVVHEPKIETVKVDDLLIPPGRKSRPSQIVVILRGLPGAGKSYVGKLIKDKEVQHGGGAPRMLCLDNYFMVEVEKSERDPETGKKVKKKMLEYEYEPEMEETYRQNMFKSFKKTIDEGFFPFIIVDAVNDKVKHFEEFWSYAKSKGFQVYIAEIDAEVAVCSKRNTHKRSLRELEKIDKDWQETPRHYLRLDIRALLQEDSITEVEMEDEVQKTSEKRKKDDDEDDDDVDENRFGGVYKKSKWEVEASEKELDKLDGLVHKKKKRTPSPVSIDDYLRDEMSRPMVPGQKRVRWADLEERKMQYRMREIGFVVGQTQQDWERITDDSFADRQLNRTKYF